MDVEAKRVATAEAVAVRRTGVPEEVEAAARAGGGGAAGDGEPHRPKSSGGTSQKDLRKRSSSGVNQALPREIASSTPARRNRAASRS